MYKNIIGSDACLSAVYCFTPYYVITSYSIHYTKLYEIIICPDDFTAESNDYLAAVKIKFTKFDIKYANHRMILGSVLSLGITLV